MVEPLECCARSIGFAVGVTDRDDLRSLRVLCGTCGRNWRMNSSPEKGKRSMNDMCFLQEED